MMMDVFFISKLHDSLRICTFDLHCNKINGKEILKAQKSRKKVQGYSILSAQK